MKAIDWQQTARVVLDSTRRSLARLVLAIGLGYVGCEPEESGSDLLASTYEIEIAGNRVPAEASLKPLYDPKSERVRS